MLAWRVIDGKFAKITPENTPWIESIGEMGGHRYPSSWLKSRYAWLGDDGAPTPSDWTEIMTRAEKSRLAKMIEDKDMQIKEDTPEAAKQTEERYQEFIREKLGALEFAVADDAVTVDHKITVCGQEIDVHVLDLEISGQEGLITPEFLEALQRSPEERRAMAKRKVLAERKGEQILRKKRTRRTDRRCRGSQLRIAYEGDAMSSDSIKQLQRELQTKTREEVWAQITYVTRAPRHGKSRKIKKVRAVSLKKVMHMKRSRTATVLDKICGDPEVDKSSKVRKCAVKGAAASSSAKEFKGEVGVPGVGRGGKFKTQIKKTPVFSAVKKGGSLFRGV